jgi:hypothetical protein
MKHENCFSTHYTRHITRLLLILYADLQWIRIDMLYHKRRDSLNEEFCNRSCLNFIFGLSTLSSVSALTSQGTRQVSVRKSNNGNILTLLFLCLCAKPPLFCPIFKKSVFGEKILQKKIENVKCHENPSGGSGSVPCKHTKRRVKMLISF